MPKIQQLGAAGGEQSELPYSYNYNYTIYKYNMFDLTTMG